MLVGPVILVSFMSLSTLGLNEICYRGMSRNRWTRYAVVMCGSLACAAAFLALALSIYVRVTIDILLLVLVLTPLTHFIVTLAAMVRQTHRTS